MSPSKPQSRFADALGRAAQQLRLPEPARSRILLEMAADLEDSYQQYLERGCDEAEAKRRAEETFAASGDALQLLARVHQPGLGDVAEGFSHHLGFGSKLLLVVLALFGLVLAARILTDRSYFVHPSPFLAPVGVLALAVFGLTVWKLVQIFSSSRSKPRRLRSGLSGLLFCAGATLAVSGLGLLYHLQRFFRLNARGAPEDLFRNFAGWMVSISSLMTVALLTALMAALFWFVLIVLVPRSEAREVEGLLASSS